MSRRTGRPSPDPGPGTSIELSRSHASGLVDLGRGGLALSSQRIAAKETPPALLQIEPTCPFGDEDVVDAWMFYEPGVGFGAQVAGQVIRDHEQISFRIVTLDST